VSLHYGFASFVYFRSKDSDAFYEDMLLAVTYTVLTPLLNPTTYSLRKKEMQTALRKVLGSVIKNFPQLTNKKAPNIKKTEH
jgi:olfactory receptor